MPQLILTIGLPASGKSTWANLVCSEMDDVVIASKDDIRKAMFPGGFKKGNEGKVIAEQNRVTREALAEGKSVIWSDTNLNPVHLKRAKTIAAEFPGTKVETKEFLDVPLAECIRRDNARADGVGERVITSMYYQWLVPKIEKDHALPTCYIFDVDGTMTSAMDRSPYDWKKVGGDTPRVEIVLLVKGLLALGKVLDSKAIKLVYLSGRDESCRAETEEWLRRWVGEFDELHMRKEGDMRDDRIVKEELYNAHIKGKYNVGLLFDDRPKVARMWKEMGLPVADVGRGVEF